MRVHVLCTSKTSFSAQANPKELSNRGAKRKFRDELMDGLSCRQFSQDAQLSLHRYDLSRTSLSTFRSQCLHLWLLQLPLVNLKVTFKDNFKKS